MTDDELVVGLRTWAARVASDTAELLRLLGEFDAREAWGSTGASSCAHWASWQLGLSVPVAREKVRVARALRTLPLLDAELAGGRVTYAQVRAITRVATAPEEQRWIELARHSTAAQLEKAVRGVNRARGGRPAREQPAARVAWEDDGTLVLTLRISAHEAPGVLAALESAQSAEQSDRDSRIAKLGTELAEQRTELAEEVPGVSAETPEAPPYAAPYDYVAPPYPRLTPGVGLFDPRPKGEEEALAAYWVENERRRVKQFAARAWADHVAARAAERDLPAAHASVADGFVRALTRPEGLPPVTVKILLDPLSGWGRTPSGELLPPTTLRDVLRTLPGRSTQRLRAQALTRHDKGRQDRLVTPALRELLGQVDGERCRFPSCDRTRHLHAHHVRFWRQGGPTDLANLVLICSRHHRLIHTEGYQLVLSTDRTLTVRTAADIPVPHHPDQQHEAPSKADIAPYTSDWQGDRFDLDYVVMVMAQQSS